MNCSLPFIATICVLLALSALAALMLRGAR